MKNYYDILELAPSATQEQIKSQYRLLIHAWHPDRFSKDEWKKIAEEKCKVFNEAYSVLSDFVKRKQYDYQQGYEADEKVNTEKSNNAKSTQYTNYTPPRKTENSSPPKTEPPISKPPTSEQPHYCESCGIVTHRLRKVSFHENRRTWFWRTTYTISGNFCKNCIDYYFWDFTGRTMLLGWWGVISFFVNIYFVLNNVFQFLLTRDLDIPDNSPAQNNPKFWMASTILGFMLIGYFILSPLLRGLSAPSFNTVTSTPKIVVVTSSPTKNPTKTVQPTMKTQELLAFHHDKRCVRWSIVNWNYAYDKGLYTGTKPICVYGNIQKIDISTNEGMAIQFDSDPGSIRIYDLNNNYANGMGVGNCILAYGTVSMSEELSLYPDYDFGDSIMITDQALCNQR